MSAFATPRNIRKKRNFKNLELTNSPVVHGAVGKDNCYSADMSGIGSGVLYDQLSNLEVGLEFKLDLRREDLQTIHELGSGNGGTVSKVLHVPTKTIMARKIVHVEAKEAVRKQIIRELQIMHDCNSPHIVSFYGAFMHENDMKFSICMEYMDMGSLDYLYKKTGPIPEPVLGKITYAVLDGLTYLYDNHRIIHRDVKPSNILINSAGLVKICDFGVSGILVDSIAKTFVGTSQYMSPERISGATYTVKSDVWSLGISLLELALGRFPFPQEGKPLSVFELLEFIVHEEMPSLPSGQFPSDFEHLIKICLVKDPAKRPTPKELMSHPYVLRTQTEKIDIEKWVQSIA
ncbi:Pkinase-domain-containing protein [Basidiobolus meristosporus CBS 931.73]|uniref:Pkinase-domain-containing protein n=1 Tax=Basidiobolus meristosporus CBS 931.73 TaxID=1314790 RepID=A0A1Y1X6W2_9FUNG|nr:Pkinase-domain-containing protein [Basidiobolus meristosporus CBS 931.73]|eukprot:ORX81455.1 Pkinase-domain-containing protein [Basidiobolus meristosporus CBS 931.73]